MAQTESLSLEKQQKHDRLKKAAERLVKMESEERTNIQKAIKARVLAQKLSSQKLDHEEQINKFMKKEKSEIENDSIFIKKLQETMKAKHQSKLREFHHSKTAADLIKQKEHELKKDKHIEHSLKAQLNKFGLQSN